MLIFLSWLKLIFLEYPIWNRYSCCCLFCRMSHNTELTSAELLQLLADVHRSPISDFSIDFFDQPVSLDGVQLDRMYWSFNADIEAACVERFNRTLKTRLFRHMTSRHTKRWIDILSSFVDSYNKSSHRTIGMSPNEVTLESSQQIVDRMYPLKTKPHPGSSKSVIKCESASTNTF